MDVVISFGEVISIPLVRYVLMLSLFVRNIRYAYKGYTEFPPLKHDRKGIF